MTDWRPEKKCYDFNENVRELLLYTDIQADMG